jgi:hypothetical protein
MSPNTTPSAAMLYGLAGVSLRSRGCWSIVVPVPASGFKRNGALSALRMMRFRVVPSSPPSDTRRLASWGL